MGIYGLYAFTAVTISGYLLGAIKGYLWRWIHWLAFPAWALSLFHVLLLAHGMQAWAQVLYVGSGVVVLGLSAARFLIRKPANAAAAATQQPARARKESSPSWRTGSLAVHIGDGSAVPLQDPLWYERHKNHLLCSRSSATLRVDPPEHARGWVFRLV